MTKKSSTELTDVTKLSRRHVIPYYMDLVVREQSAETDAEVERVNRLILSKWTPKGLLYIKTFAWRYMEKLIKDQQVKN